MRPEMLAHRLPRSAFAGLWHVIVHLLDRPLLRHLIGLLRSLRAKRRSVLVALPSSMCPVQAVSVHAV